MLVIRLSRVGKRNQAIYRIVVAEKEKSAQGKFIEELGTYNPRFEKDNLKLNNERVKHWLDNGAQPSLTVSGILKKEGILPEKLTKKYDLEIEHIKKFRKKKKKKAAEEGDEKADESPKAEGVEPKQEEEKVADESKEQAEEEKPAEKKEEKEKAEEVKEQTEEKKDDKVEEKPKQEEKPA